MRGGLIINLRGGKSDEHRCIKNLRCAVYTWSTPVGAVSLQVAADSVDHHQS
jgi:hypothetical protein